MNYHTDTGQVALPIILISLIFLPHENGIADALPHRALSGSAACFFLPESYNSKAGTGSRDKGLSGNASPSQGYAFSGSPLCPSVKPTITPTNAIVVQSPCIGPASPPVSSPSETPYSR